MRSSCSRPTSRRRRRRTGCDRAIDGRRPAIRNFLDVLLENHRMPVIFRVRREYDRLWDEANDLLPVDGHERGRARRGRRRSASATRSAARPAARVELTQQVDPAILGGFVVRVGNAILDASIRNRLEQLRKQVARA